jgi:hypothetical protein
MTRCLVKRLCCPVLNAEVPLPRGMVTQFHLFRGERDNDAVLAGSKLVLLPIRSTGVARPCVDRPSAAFFETGADFGAQTAPWPTRFVRFAEPEVLLRFRERGHLRMMSKADVVSPAGQREPPCYPCAVTKSLVVEGGLLDGIAVAAGASDFSVNQPVA